MNCPSCDEPTLCVIKNERGTVARVCSNCGFAEDASPAEVHDFLQGFEPDTLFEAPPVDPKSHIEEARRRLASVETKEID